MLFEPLEDRKMMVGDAGHSTPGQGDDWVIDINTYVPAAYSATPIPGALLSAPSQAAPLTIAVNYLKANASKFGASANDFNNFSVSANYKSSHNDVTHVYLQQTFNGLPVQDAVAAVSITKNGQVITASSSFIPGLQHPASLQPIVPAFEATEALEAFERASVYGRETEWTSVEVNSNARDRATLIKVGTTQKIEIQASLHYVPKAGGGVELAWRLSHILVFTGDHGYDISVGLEQGSPNYARVFRVADWVAHASYNVFPLPAESPAETAQTILVDPHDLIASPFGWHDTDGRPGAETPNTSGNNVIAQEDLDGDDLNGFRPAGGPNLDFNYPANLAGSPLTYTEAAIVNLFYVSNVMHDVFYHYGFDEVSGNFQQVNYTGLGRGGDAVIADAQDGSFFNNAQMFTPPDGQPPRMEQFLFTLTLPFRDSSLENGIIAHEYTHGISNRLTGGPMNAGALQGVQSGGMGEGWSDFVALWITQTPTETAATPRPMGNYVLGQPATGGGIRRFPYSVDMTINPLTLDAYNGSNQVHDAGEIWASVLWDINWAMINKYGYSSDVYNGTGGNNLAMQLVIDGMKLQPANPTFMQARDAIIAADIINNGGANWNELWAAFARRGFGYGADDGGSPNSPVIVEDFTVPPPLATVSGVVYVDANKNANREASEQRLSGITVYVDANNNSVLDLGENSTVSAADGTYNLSLGLGQSTFVIRQQLDPTLYTQTEPAGGAGYVINTNSGSVFTGYDFGNIAKPGEITGIKWNDLNGDGVRDPGEPGMAGIMIYVDLNNDGRIGVLEPAGVSDANGFYRISNVSPGSYTIREVLAPGSIPTFPAADVDNNIPAGVYVNVVITSGQTLTLDFGNSAAFDWGDAPNSYGTLASSNGARHAIMPNFGLALPGQSNVVSAESNGQPDSAANLDNLDNGVRFTPMTPGEMTRIYVGAITGGRSAGYLQGWMDFDNDGVFEANEKIVSDFRLVQSTEETEIPFMVPSTAVLGSTYARFRYGYERGSQSSPVGAASIGEVEDYLVDFRPTDPVAVVDGPFIVKQDTSNNVFDVLANDIGSTADNGAPPVWGGFVGGTLSATTAQGGTVVFDTATQRVLYTPEPGFIGNDSFQYFVQDSFGTPSDPVRVDIIVNPTDPFAVDDTYRVDINSTNNSLAVLLNDIPNTGIRVAAVRNLDGTAVDPNTIRPGGANNSVLIYTPPQDFQGTVQYEYEITDNDPGTVNRRAIVTIQVTPDATTPASTHQAQLSLRIFDQDGNAFGDPGFSIDVNETFTVQAFARDLRPGGNQFNRGVEAAYMDVLFDYNKAELLNIVHAPNYSLDAAGSNNRPGIVNEVGGTHNYDVTPPLPFGPGNVLVFTLQMRATGTGSIQFVADPAETAPGQQGRTDVLVYDETDQVPNVVPDTNVFLISTPTVVIGNGAGGEGEFTNSSQPLDVNFDGHITSLDALIVINDINARGSREVSQVALAMSGELPPEYYIDVDLDGHVSPIDALNVINWLNSNPIQPSNFGGSGEGEAEGEAFGALTPVVGSAIEAGEGEAPSSAAVLLNPLQKKSSAAPASESSDSAGYQPVSYSSFSPSVVDLILGEDEEEIVTGSNSSSEETSFDLEATDA
jgi:hypothetical protein